MKKVKPLQVLTGELAAASPSRKVLGKLGLLDRRSHDVDRPAATLGTELDNARGGGEQRVVAATADVHARVEVGTALADEDLAGLDQLAAESLDTEPLGGGVATVA
jgi:hypothetical protein